MPYQRPHLLKLDSMDNKYFTITCKAKHKYPAVPAMRPTAFSCILTCRTNSKKANRISSATKSSVSNNLI